MNPRFETIAAPFGTFTSGIITDLRYYKNLTTFEESIDKQIEGIAMQTTTTKIPDLKFLKNYNFTTGYLVVHLINGEDYSDEKYMLCWKKSNTLAQYLTLKEINALYGEGKRAGTIKSRPMLHSLRAIHWSWMALDKQREILKKIGCEITDHDFEKEKNYVMAESLFRLYTSLSKCPSKMGFQPFNKATPLESIFSMVKANYGVGG